MGEMSSWKIKKNVINFIKIHALFFGMSKVLAGQSTISIELDEGLTVKEFRELLQQKYVSFSEMDTYAIAVNESYANEDLTLNENDTVAIIPPVSGG